MKRSVGYLVRTIKHMLYLYSFVVFVKPMSVDISWDFKVATEDNSGQRSL